MAPEEHDEDEGRGRSPRPPLEVAPLRAWWLVLAGLVVALLFVATDHILRATVSLAGTLLLAAAIRVFLPPEQAGGVIVRGRAADIGVLVTLGVLVLVSGFTLDLGPR